MSSKKTLISQRIPSHLSVLEILLFNFQRPMPARRISSPDSFTIIPDSFRFVKGFFKTFLSFFQNPQISLGYAPLLLKGLIVYHLFFLLSRGFLKVFGGSSPFFPFVKRDGFRTVSFVHFDYRCTRPEAFPSASAFTSSMLTRLKSPSMLCFKQPEAVASSTAHCGS